MNNGPLAPSQPTQSEPMDRTALLLRGDAGSSPAWVLFAAGLLLSSRFPEHVGRCPEDGTAVGLSGGGHQSEISSCSAPSSVRMITCPFPISARFATR